MREIIKNMFLLYQQMHPGHNLKLIWKQGVSPSLAGPKKKVNKTVCSKHTQKIDTDI